MDERVVEGPFTTEDRDNLLAAIYYVDRLIGEVSELRVRVQALEDYIYRKGD